VEAAGGHTGGARITDLVTGSTLTARALVVVNATGPWSDEIRGTLGERGTLHRTKGIHVVVPRARLGNREALLLTSPIDGRVMFVVPWGEVSYIGTTESEIGGTPDEVCADADEVVYLLRSVNAYFPEVRLTTDDVRATWAGVRPLVRHATTEDPRAVSREHVILESPTGMISIVGGKLTTYRSMAAEVVDRVARRLHERDGRTIAGPAATDRRPLPGGESADLDVFARATGADGFSDRVAAHLVHTYGSETPAIVRLTQADARLAGPVVKGHTTLWAELVHAIRREMAITLGDLLIRRTHLFYADPDQGLGVIEAVADLAGKEMGWDAERRAAELAAYRHEVDRNQAFRRA
jgi:glycerol-3-phosphate dehydrogenase